MSLEFKFIQPGDKDFHFFKEVLVTVYGANSQRVKQKGAVEKEYLMGCLVGLKEGVPVARCSMYNNSNHYFNKVRFGCFGQYECIKDDEVAREFLQKVITTFKAFRLPYLVGPMDGSIWNNHLLQYNTNEPAFYPEKQQQSYYHQQLKAQGFQVVSEYVSHKDTHLEIDMDELDYARGRFENVGLEIRPIDANNLEYELKRMGEFCNENQKDNIFYSPITPEDFYEKTKVVENFMNEDLILLAEDKEGNLAGFSYAYQDPYNSLGKTIVIKMVIRTRDSRYKGLGKFLGGMIYKYAIQNRFNAIIHAFMKVGNPSTLASFEYSGTNTYYKRYAMYGLKLEE